MRDEFHIVLLSNSSMLYYPDNTTSHFVTKLPQHINLAGDWSVALVDIHVPLTFQNVSRNEEDRRVKFSRSNSMLVEDSDERFYIVSPEGHVNKPEIVDHFTVSSGIYTDLTVLIKEINSYERTSHLRFTLESGAYVSVRKSCDDSCSYDTHSLELSDSLRRILGFQHTKTKNIEDTAGGEIFGNCPASINNDLPTNLLVYTDICEPYITGDVYTRLLRNVALDLNNYTYGRVMSANFSRPVYIPLLTTSFQTIEIDLRNQYGKHVPFDFGTLTITLHFKQQNTH